MAFRNKKDREEINSDEENESQNKIREIQMTIEDAKLNVNQAISKAIDRSENLEHLNEKALNMQESALDFNREARRVRRQMWCQNVKVNIALCTVIFFIALILFLVLILPLMRK